MVYTYTNNIIYIYIFIDTSLSAWVSFKKANNPEIKKTSLNWKLLLFL